MAAIQVTAREQATPQKGTGEQPVSSRMCQNCAGTDDLSPHSNPMKQGQLSSPFYRWEN